MRRLTLRCLGFCMLLLAGCTIGPAPAPTVVPPSVSPLTPSPAPTESVVISGGGVALLWHTVSLDAPQAPPQGLSPRALALYGATRHVAYGGGALHYGWYDGTRWYTSTVDAAAGPTQDTALALDGSGRPHILYYAPGDGELRYARYDGSAWQTIPVAQLVGEVGNAIVVDAADRPHIAYGGGASGAIRYGFYDGTAWQIETLGGEIGSWPSLVLDAAGWPHLSYEAAAGDLRYAWKDEAGWHAEHVDGGGLHSSLALDAGGRPHIVFVSGDGWLSYAYHDGAAWQVQRLDAAGSQESPSLALDAAGRPWISYRRWAAAPESGLHCVHWDGTAWIRAQADEGGSGGFSAIVLDAAGWPHIAYLADPDGDNDADALRYAYYDSQSWRRETVHLFGWAGRGSSLALDSRGFPHVAYWRSGELFYATFGGRSWRYWQLDSCAIGEGDFASTSLALDTAGHPHIAYTCAPHGTYTPPRYAYFDGSAWLTEAISPDPAVGHVALAVDPQGHPRVGFYNQAQSYLEYAWRDGAWQHERVASDAAGGGKTTVCLAVDAGGRPHIAYQGIDPPGSVPTLDYGYRAESGRWVTTTVEAGSGVYPSLALDAAGRPHIGFSRPDSADIRYAWYDGGTWKVEALPSRGFNQYPALALAPSGEPGMVYYGLSPEGTVVYAYRDDSGWHTKTLALVAGDTISGGDTSIAMDAAGLPHLTYFNWSMQDLIYIWQSPPERVFMPLLYK